MKSLHSLLSPPTPVLLLHLSLIFTTTFVAGRPNFFQNNPSTPPNPSSDPWQPFHKFAGCHKGDHIAGLAKLKQYLHQFGYIPSSSSSSSNFTDNFDETLESALKLYQKNFNLNATGKLDNTTVQMIARPRCGDADIINGTTSMNSGKPAHTTLHTVSHYSFFQNSPKWPDSKRNLTYAFLPANQLEANAKAVFSRAFQRWSTVTPLTFTEIDSYEGADIKIGFFVGNHGDGEAFDGTLGTLAHAFSPTTGLFHLDGDEEWVVDGDVTKSTSSNAIDLESVSVHEIGHVLGLGHSSVQEAIMYPSISAGIRKTGLANDDIQGIQVLYGGNPNYVPSTSTPSNTENDTNDGGVRIVDWHWRLTMVMATVASMSLLL
ncbi:metalloendoproteinase 5-MMP-like [Telopea speciosissima]|uniref:metalloendoproteinase 5-MMP-like n=1 Tax=Telopea speciosissima TaxID=54955 RepID=UPI001CC52EAE|nr:metalloendoproteinase 5-MMP-like [Telopea speciosissima]